MSEQQIQLPRLGGHLAAWGSSGMEHRCVTEEAHDGPCVCECGETNEVTSVE